MAGSNATATYTVITDTHGYPWGPTTADFDLGDNTNATELFFKEAIHSTNATKMTLCGNHDVFVTNKNHGCLQTYYDDENKVIFFGLDTVDTDVSLTTIRVPQSQINQMATILNQLTTGWDVVVLSHIPVFPNPKSTSEWPFHNGAVSNYLEIIELLQDYKSSGKGNVIGCFAGHVHNRLQCYYNGIYMETFNANGGDEYKYSNCNNGGWYQPTINTININFQNKTVNTHSYTSISLTDPSADGPRDVSANVYGSAATGLYSMYQGGTSYPKFYQGRYVGYSYDSSTGADYRNTIDGAWWYVNNAYFHGLSKNVQYVRFDAAGELRYYSTNGHDNTDFQEIPNYKNAHIVFDTVPCPSTSPGKTWTFINGLFEGVRSTPSFSYKSGVLPGQNGYSIEFNSNGLATGITHYNQDVTYGAGDNWINVSSILVCWRGFGDMESTDSTSNYAQVGITGTFPSGGIKLNLARSTATGYNWIPNSVNLLMRVVGSNSQPYWFYDGRLTTLTDAQVGI